MAARKPITRIINRGKGHSYLLDGEPVPGVTSLLSKGYPKSALIDWAARTTAGYAVDHWDELAGMTPSQRLNKLQRARWDDVGEASERGREVHKLGHKFMAGEEIVIPEALTGHVDAYIKFMDEWLLEEVAVECACFSRAFKYGGRFDLLARLRDGQLWIVDFKTSRSGVFIETALQLAAYRYSEFYVLDGEPAREDGGAHEHPMPKVDAAGVVWLRADGYDLYPFEAGSDVFAVFGAVQQTAEFNDAGRDAWIGDALQPPLEAQPATTEETT